MDDSVGVFVKKFNGFDGKKRLRRELKAARRYPSLIPRVIRYSEELQEIHYELVDPQPVWSNQDLWDIGAMLATIHQGDLTSVHRWPESLFEKYRRVETDPHVKKIFEIRDQIQPIKMCYTHGDFRLGNLAKGEDRIKILDWEFAGPNFLYWDVAIFIADLRHQQYHRSIRSLYPENFLFGYRSKIQLSPQELAFCDILGGLDITFDHLYPEPGEKPPAPRKQFLGFSEEERAVLFGSLSLDVQTYRL